MTAPVTSEWLLSLAKSGDPGAPGALYDRFSADVNRLVWRFFGADDEHDDLVQQVFAQIFAGVARVRDPAALPTWVVSVCVKTVRTEIRRRKLRRLLRMDGGTRAHLATAPAMDHESRQLLQRTLRVLDALRADQRIVFTLRYVEDLSLAEIADACTCSLATVKRRLARAERRFQTLAGQDPALAERLSQGQRRSHDAA